MRSARDLVGVDEFGFREMVVHFLLAAVIISIASGLAATIIFGMLIYYNHIDHMTDRGYVLVNRRIGSGLTAKDVTEWVKDDQRQVDIPDQEKAEGKGP
jgi:hypothetical protein